MSADPPKKPAIELALPSAGWELSNIIGAVGLYLGELKSAAKDDKQRLRRAYLRALRSPAMTAYSEMLHPTAKDDEPYILVAPETEFEENPMKVPQFNGYHSSYNLDTRYCGFWDKWQEAYHAEAPDLSRFFSDPMTLMKELTYQKEEAGLDNWKSPMQSLEDGFADCEDYALAWIKILEQMGKEPYLLIVRQIGGGAHAVTICEDLVYDCQAGGITYTIDQGLRGQSQWKSPWMVLGPTNWVSYSKDKPSE